jgi:hypothetical protein
VTKTEKGVNSKYFNIVVELKIKDNQFFINASWGIG